MGTFDILKTREPDADHGERHGPVLFSTAFAGLGVDTSLLVPWEARAAEVDVRRPSPGRGTRFSASSTMNDCEIAILTAEGIDDMMTERPRLAARLIALLARKLSLRLRIVGARLSEKK